MSTAQPDIYQTRDPSREPLFGDGRPRRVQTVKQSQKGTQKRKNKILRAFPPLRAPKSSQVKTGRGWERPSWQDREKREEAPRDNRRHPHARTQRREEGETRRESGGNNPSYACTTRHEANRRARNVGVYFFQHCERQPSSTEKQRAHKRHKVDRRAGNIGVYFFQCCEKQPSIDRKALLLWLLL